MDSTSPPYYGKTLTRIDMADLRCAAEDTFHTMYNRMLDHIAVLENRIGLLERKNRELRGEVARSKVEKV